MKSVCYCVLILSSQLVFSHHIPKSPCPGIFDYASDGTSNFGVIRLRATERVSYIVLKAKFSIEEQLSSNDYVGRVEAQDGDTLLDRFNQGSQVLFRVHFPRTTALPHLTTLTVNDITLCQGQEVQPHHPGTRPTRYSLQFTSYPRGDGHGHVYSTIPLLGDTGSRPLFLIMNDDEAAPPANNQLQPNYDQPSKSPGQLRELPVQPRTPVPPIDYETTPRRTYNTANEQSSYPKVLGCGQVVGGNDNVPLIYNGEAYTRGDIPWLVAIYKARSGSLNFVCGGTLISDQHVVTAAHCMQLRHEITPVKNFVVKVGVHDLGGWSDDYTVTRSIAAASIHDNYNATTLSNDILVLTFDKPVEFNNYIRPICLWGGNSELSYIVGATGVVAGWGQQSQLGLIGEGVPHMVRVPIASNEQCKASRKEFHALTSTKTLCAGDRKGAGPCNGDSGGGLYLLDGGKWRLRGVVSISLRANNGESLCNLNEYIVFTDAAQFTDWIKSIMAGNHNNNYYN